MLNLSSIKKYIVNNKFFVILLISIILVLVSLFVKINSFNNPNIIEDFWWRRRRRRRTATNSVSPSGNIKNIIITEGQSATISATGSDKYLNIVAAIYGGTVTNRWRGRWGRTKSRTRANYICVTNQIQSLVDGKSSYTITANNAYGDPLGGVVKNLNIYYFTSDTYLKSFNSEKDAINISVNNNQTLKIVYASFGVYTAPNNNFTDQVQRLVDGKSSYSAGAIWQLIGDPARGSQKTFSVKYYGVDKATPPPTGPSVQATEPGPPPPPVPPPPALKNFVFIGSYKDSAQRAIPNYKTNITSLEQAIQSVQNDNAEIIGLQNNGQLFYGTDFAAAIKYGKADNCANTLGCSWMNHVYLLKPSKAHNDYLAKLDADRIAEEAAAKAKAAAEEAERLRRLQSIYNDLYTPTPTASCGFYFKKDDFTSLFSNNTTEELLEKEVVKNNYGYCFNIDNDKSIYVNTNGQAYYYTYNDKKTDKKYTIKFNIIESKKDYLICFKAFLNSCDKISSVSYNLDYSGKNVKCLFKNLTCIVNLKSLNNTESVLSQLTPSNIININYNNTIIKNFTEEKYTYGKLNYTNTDFYDCIVMTN